MAWESCSTSVSDPEGNPFHGMRVTPGAPFAGKPRQEWFERFPTESVNSMVRATDRLRTFMPARVAAGLCLRSFKEFPRAGGLGLPRGFLPANKAKQDMAGQCKVDGIVSRFVRSEAAYGCDNLFLDREMHRRGILVMQMDPEHRETGSGRTRMRAETSREILQTRRDAAAVQERMQARHRMTACPE